MTRDPWPNSPKSSGKRIKSVSSTKKITRTMEMVATAKLKQAQQRVQSSGPYLAQLRALMREIGGSGVDVTRWPQFEAREGKRTLLFLLTANRGLCGAFNANLIRLARNTYLEKKEAGHEVRVHVAGRKGFTAFRYQGIPLERTYMNELVDRPEPKDADFFLEALTRPFLEGEVDEVLIVYPHWETLAKQPPTLLRLLPIAPDTGTEAETKGAGVPPLFEPSPEAILDQLLPLYLRQTIYAVLSEAVAGEQLARRMAMKLATDNANEMVTNLTRQYNRARQALITKELAEILGGAEALRK
ncbi:MAG: ATP synthase F1 subunit gamma [Planctomycetes bacterium]|nr:ATP synthase F1 subunit gamma [Planctomycetota bacterium]